MTLKSQLRLTHPDALTHSDAVSINRTCVHARAHAYPSYTELRRSASVRQSPSGTTGELTGQALEELANRVRSLVPSHRHPEAFHEAKSEIEAELRRLSRVLPTGRHTGRAERRTSLDGGDLSPKVSGLRKG